ncbi:MAG: hypothetical protein LBU65_06760 [Planctomycetaceae bacterium]|jgi:septal ring factor EnvC (AmiA/AmiB activator)|nr:hypothetical protein [Planctomycetaceae bacterium]
MNNIGKIFITLIFLLAVMFMSFSLVLYATHANWKVENDKVKKELTDTNDKLRKLETSRAEMTAAYEKEIERRAKEILALEEKVKESETEREKLTEEKTKLVAEQQKNIAAVELAHTSLQASRDELEGLRKDNRDLHADWDKLFHKLVEQTDEAHDLSVKLANLRSVSEQLAKDYRDACEVLKIHGQVPKPELYSGIPPKGIEGIVTEVRPDGWLEISIGEDAGIMKGHKLDVYRQANGQSAYIGKIEVHRTEPDKAACRILPEFRKGTIQREDTVGYISLAN